MKTINLKLQAPDIDNDLFYNWLLPTYTQCHKTLSLEQFIQNEIMKTILPHIMTKAFLPSLWASHSPNA